MSQQSAACCTREPAVAGDYKPKGTYANAAGTKYYLTGPAKATKGILMVYDIFGYCSQTLQGADILAYSNKENPYLVIVPDFLDGTPAEPAWFSPTASSSDKAKLGAFFKDRGAYPKSAARIPGILNEVSKSEGIAEWGALGLCWGGKVVTVQSMTGSEVGFKAAAQVHPSLVDPEEAKKITIPFAVLASGDEDKATLEKFGANLKGEKVLDTYSDMPHGWMGARAKLDDDRARSEYERGYKTISDFFAKYL